jgi:hypothetical protein
MTMDGPRTGIICNNVFLEIGDDPNSNVHFIGFFRSKLPDVIL